MCVIPFQRKVFFGEVKTQLGWLGGNTTKRVISEPAAVVSRLYYASFPA